MTPRCEIHSADKTQRIRDGKKSGWYCRGCANDKSKAYRLSAPDAYLNNKLWTFYRIRLADFHRMLDEQGGQCKACGTVPPSDKNGIADTGLCIDHDHQCCRGQRQGGGTICGKCVRGLLCTQCNIALGMVGDDPARLRALAQYVEDHQLSSSPTPLITAESA